MGKAIVNKFGYEYVDFLNTYSGPINGSLMLALYNGKVLIINHKERRQWEFPAGTFEDESPLTCGIRELKEETCQAGSFLSLGTMKLIYNKQYEYHQVYTVIIDQLSPFLENSEVSAISFVEELPENFDGLEFYFYENFKSKIQTQWYYQSFLNLQEGQSVVKSLNRQLPLNKSYYYPIIATEYLGEWVYSVDPTYYDLFMSVYNKVDTPEVILSKMLMSDHIVRSMYRMTGGQVKKCNPVTCISEDLIRVLHPHDSENYISKAHVAIREKNNFLVIKDKEWCASARITDHQNIGCNIAVYVKEEHRKKGYGRDVVNACTIWSYEHKKLPIYLVVTENTASVNLAKSLDYAVFAKEWILSIEKD